MGLGQYRSLREYCGPHTASSVFLITVSVVSTPALVTNWSMQEASTEFQLHSEVRAWRVFSTAGFKGSYTRSRGTKKLKSCVKKWATPLNIKTACITYSLWREVIPGVVSIALVDGVIPPPTPALQRGEANLTWEGAQRGLNILLRPPLKKFVSGPVAGLVFSCRLGTFFYVFSKNYFNFLPPEKRKKLNKFCSRQTDHNFGHPVDKKQLFLRVASQSE